MGHAQQMLFEQLRSRFPNFLGATSTRRRISALSRKFVTEIRSVLLFCPAAPQLRCEMPHSILLCAAHVHIFGVRREGPCYSAMPHSASYRGSTPLCFIWKFTTVTEPLKGNVIRTLTASGLQTSYQRRCWCGLRGGEVAHSATPRALSASSPGSTPFVSTSSSLESASSLAQMKLRTTGFRRAIRLDDTGHCCKLGPSATVEVESSHSDAEMPRTSLLIRSLVWVTQEPKEYMMSIPVTLFRVRTMSLCLLYGAVLTTVSKKLMHHQHTPGRHACT